MIMNMTIFTYTRWQIINLSLKYEQIYSKYNVDDHELIRTPLDENDHPIRTYHWWRPPWIHPHRSLYPPPSLSDPHPLDKSPYAGGNLPPPAVRTYWIQTWTNVHTLKKMNVFCMAGNHRSLDPSQLNSIIFSKKMTSSGKILYVWRTSVELGIENESK